MRIMKDLSILSPVPSAAHWYVVGASRRSRMSVPFAPDLVARAAPYCSDCLKNWTEAAWVETETSHEVSFCRQLET
jgi:hypothetical protein